MSKFGSDENCIDPAAFMDRNFAGDRIIKMLLVSMAPVEEIRLGKTFWDEWCNQMGSKRPEYVYGHWGKTKIVGPSDV